jgi:predicted nucleic acid-binding protein
LESGALQIGFSLAENISEVRALLRKYADRPMSLADACLLRMAELNARHLVFTLDSDFSVYRKHGRQPVKVISPKSS